MSKRAGAEGEAPLPRRDPAGAGRSRGRIPTRFNRQNPPSERIAVQRPGRSARAALPAPQQPEAPAYSIRPGSPEQQPPAAVQPSRPPTAEEWAAVNNRQARPQSQAQPGGQAPAAAPYAIRPGAPEENPRPSEGEPQPQSQPQPQPSADAPGATAPASATAAAATTPARPAPGRRRGRRGRRLAVTLTVAVVVIGGGIAAGVGLTRGGGTHHDRAAAGPPSPASSAEAANTAAPSPQPSPAAVDPLVYLSTAAKDTAPLSEKVFFPAVIPHTPWTRIAANATPNCASAVSPALAADLKAQSCKAVYRATYRSGSTAVTVGVAVFGDSGQAALAKRNARAGNVDPLYAKGTPPFCKAVTCRMTVNALGRYAYFTVAGYTTGKPVPATDKEALNAGDSAATLVFDDLAARARAAAEARGSAAGGRG